MRIAALLLASSLAAQVQTELLFPPEKLHNHSSSLVELANGDLLAAWYRGSGERGADDVRVMISRLPRGSRQWTAPRVLADEPGFPDTNPLLVLDAKQQPRLFWSTILANRWETALLRYGPVAATPTVGVPLLFAPHQFSESVSRDLPAVIERMPDTRHRAEMEQALKYAADKYASRMGWMLRNHALRLPSGRVLLPLYSDLYNFSLVARSDDDLRTWKTSAPLVSAGGVQPSLVRGRDGIIRAWMRDNGPRPHRALISESKDDGETWSPVVDSDIVNSGSSMEVILLRDGTQVMIWNDLDDGRHELTVALSEDDGVTWPVRRIIAAGHAAKDRFHYPSLIQTRDGALHATWSEVTSAGETIRHIRFAAAWIKARPTVPAVSGSVPAPQ
jgi:predicted neuraminidase